MIVFQFRVLWVLELGEVVIHDLRGAMLTHLLAQPLGFFQRQRVGTVGVKDVAFVGTVQLGSMIGAALIMLFYDAQLFFVLCGLLPLLAAIIRHFRGRMLEAYRASQESFSFG